ncbi:MAG: PAS domain S-box protein [Pseudomonadota bacterium]|nr:PAS domain S-box protein [Pseudomonadota bacterium]MEA3240943.1 PAS domain S-box protein [Pseudomonadota bacterium]
MVSQDWQYYRLLIENVDSIILRLDSRGKILYLNPFGERFFGYAATEILGKSVVGTIVPQKDSSGKDLQDMIGNLVQQPELYQNNENENMCKDGRRIWISWTNKAFYGEPGELQEIFCIGHDITDKKLAEKELLESKEELEKNIEEKNIELLITNEVLEAEREELLRFQVELKESKEWLRVLIDGIPDIICLKDGDGCWQITNQACRQIFQLGEEGYIKKSNVEMSRLHGDFSQVFLEGKEMDALAWEQGKVYRREQLIPDVFGRKMIFEVAKIPVFHPDGSRKGLVSIGHDITALKQGAKALEESEEKYRTVLESNPDPVVVYDREGLVVYLNPAFTRVFGWTMEELQGRKLDHFVPEETWPLTKMMIEKVLAGENFSGYETKRFNKDGQEIPVSISAAIYHTKEGDTAGSVINLRDISVQKELESKLQRAQKMEGIGLLAAGVAHDLNNVLSGLVTYPELILQKVGPDDPLRKSLLIIQKSGEKAAAIVNDLLTLARRGADTKEVVNLNRIITDYLESPEFEKLTSLYPDINLMSKLAPDLLNMVGSHLHLIKTVMNLVVNAMEAMSAAGTLTIETGNCYVDGTEKSFAGVAEGEYVVCKVADTGTGIPEADIEKIFEPFYSKKVMGRSGTGLGMAIIWNAVHDHQGHIDVQSAEDKGTTFSLYFPATRQQLYKSAGIISADEYTGKGEHILVVDDLADQRQIAAEMLQSLGYKITSLASGEEAVAYLEDHAVDLVILDMIMDPGIDGLETYRRISAGTPGQKVIIASGYSESERVREAQRLGAGAYVKKPYLLAKIGLVVRRTLDS